MVNLEADSDEPMISRHLSMKDLVVALGRYRWLHTMIGWFRLYPLSERVMRQFPIQRRLGVNGIRYRLTSLDQLSIEIELFSLDAYAAALEKHVVQSFIDLGCNAGWFALWLSTHLQSKPWGLLVDAHPRMVSEARWHLRTNGLFSCEVVHGAVGFPATQERARFYLQSSAAASSAVPFRRWTQLPTKGRIKTILVPALSVEREWRSRYADAFVDILKVDIEGKELDFVNVERSFLRSRVRRVIVEWHKWAVDLSQLAEAFHEAGFVRTRVPSEGPITGVAVFDNPAIADFDDIATGRRSDRDYS